MDAEKKQKHILMHLFFLNVAGTDINAYGLKETYKFNTKSNNDQNSRTYYTYCTN